MSEYVECYENLKAAVVKLAGVIVKAAKSAAKSALDAAKSALGIHSPSRVFRDQVGKMMALGMGIGFEKNIPIKSMNVGVPHAERKWCRYANVSCAYGITDRTTT